MFFKRLEIHGFKSFGHKVSIDFMPGVTIVVGPNGCGKSNVLDSIRWVLGETSAKSLRGAKMGDVVFRGSASLKAAGFAQVNLIVNNEGRLPVDQSEVMVTRRLFSNGDSDYMLNKQKARMKDIHELFLDTGLGADGYSVIEQGQIGQIVASKPTERREIFEEAAGISRYKLRREETLRKLVRTEEDLIRLFDIVNEVERSCNSLYRQAKKAERHRRLTRRLDRARKRLVVLRYRLVKDRLKGVEERLAAARDAFEGANATLAQAEARRAESTRLMEEYQRQLAELQQEKYDLQNRVNREQRTIESARQRQGEIAERAALLDRELSSSTSRLQILQNTISALQVDLDRERASLGPHQLDMEEKARALDALRREHDLANSDLVRLRSELDTERAKLNKVMQDKRLAESLIERLARDLAQHDELVARVRVEAEEATAEARAATEALTAIRARLHELRTEWNTLKTEVAEGDKARNTMTGELDEITRAFNKGASRLQALQEVEDSYEGFFRGVQVIMKASQQGRLQGIYGVLTNVITVPKEYETAVEVALGGSLQDIIAYSEEDARRAIEYLKQTNNGRATFLPLSHLERLNGPLRLDIVRPVIGRAGVIGLAKELIKYDPVIEPAIQRRLGTTLVVNELKVALDLQRQGQKHRYVSLDGQLADPSGIMTGGSHQSRGFLSRAREISELRDQVSEIDARRKAMGEKLTAMKDRLSVAHARAAELQALLHQEQMAEARHEKDQQSSEARARDRRNSLATAEARQVQQRHDLGKHRETVELCDASLGTLEGMIAEKEGAYRALEGQFGGRAQELESRADAAAHARAALASLKERVQSMATKLEEVQHDLANAGNEQGSRTRERATLDEQRAEAARAQEQSEGLLATLVRERDDVENRLNALVAENEINLKDARAGVAEIQGLQRDRNQKENALREVENQATELRAQVNLLAEEAQQNFEVQTVEQLAAMLEQTTDEETDLLVAPGETTEQAEATAATEEEELHDEDEQISDPAELRRLVNELQTTIQRLGAVNETAIEEYKEQKHRLDFLTAQRDDLIAAKDALQETIAKLDETTSRLFHEAFDQIQKNFQENFRRLFNGGKGDLILVADEKEPEPGIEIWAQPPGKNIGGSINLMSGGEKAMTAICLMLSLFQYKPSPICILDEIDAPLDDVNCQRLCNALKEMAQDVQFLIITHNKITMALADTIYGVTMQEPGISKMVSVKFDKIDESGLLDGVAG